jgi:WD40 repeat protein
MVIASWNGGRATSLYQTTLANTPIDLAASYVNNDAFGYGQATVLDEAGFISVYPLAFPSNAPTVIGATGDSFIYKMAVSSQDSAIAAVELGNSETNAGTTIQLSGLFSDPNGKMTVPIPLEQGISLTDVSMETGLIAFPNGDMTGGPNPDTPMGIWYYNLIEASASESFIAHDAPVIGVLISKYGSYIATVSINGTYRVWDISATASEVEAATPTLVGTVSFDTALLNLTGGHQIMAFAPDNEHLAIGDRGGTVSIWDFKTDDMRTVEAFPDSPIQHVAFSADGSLLAVSAGVMPSEQSSPSPSQDNSIHLYDVDKILNSREDSLLTSLTGATQTVTGLAFNPDGRMLVSTAADKSFTIWGVVQSQEDLEVSQVGDAGTP